MSLLTSLDRSVIWTLRIICIVCLLGLMALIALRIIDRTVPGVGGAWTDEIIELLFGGMVFCNRTLGFVNAPAFMQRVVAGLQDVQVEMSGYLAKRDKLYHQLTASGYQVVKPQGAFYMFPRALEQDDVAFVRKLQEQLVLVVPGTGFGMPGYFRISYAVEDRVVDGALAGFARVAEQYR